MSEGTWPANAPASMNVDGVHWSLQVEAWRSMQPGAGDRNDALLVLLRVSASSPIPGDTRLSSVQLRHGGETWSGEAKEEMPREAGTRNMELMVREGPRWPIDDTVTVLTRLERPGRQLAVLGARAIIARVD